MAFEGTFKNYYEALGVAENAPAEVIQQTLNGYRESLEPLLGNPMLMKGARYALNEIVPAIERNLLSGLQIRAAYDQQLVAHKQGQTQHIELDDDEGLDDGLRKPFFFDPFNSYDTETYALTIRDIATKFDEEWERARICVTDISDETHVLVGFLNYAAQRLRLAAHIEQIVAAATRKDGQRMDTNEAVERCIAILNPRVERADVGIHSPNFDGQTLDAGSFIADLPAYTNFTLCHEGIRGCAFGVIESRTTWVTFQGGQSTIRFSLLPTETTPTIGPSEMNVQLLLQVGNLERNTNYSAELVLRLENYEPAKEYIIRVNIHVPPLPPRVMFEPAPTAMSPIWAGTTRRGTPTSVVMIARNVKGDVELVPLVARISTQSPGAYAQPERFHANEPITLMIDTSNRSYGKVYEVIYTVDYSPVAGAQGLESIHVRGEILPTIRQSIFREKDFSGRSGVGCLLGFIGLLVVGLLGAGLEAHLSIWWLLLAAIPLLCIGITRSIVSTIIIHQRRSGDTSASIDTVSNWVLWGIPAAVGTGIGLVCMLLPSMTTAFFLGAIVGFITFATFGFMTDNARAKNPTSVPPSNLPPHRNIAGTSPSMNTPTSSGQYNQIQY